MTRSMTAFAALSTHLGEIEVKWELRTVNSRYLEMHFRLPECWRALEFPLRERIRQVIARGKVDVSLTLKETQANQTLEVNAPLVQALLSALDIVEQQMPVSSSFSPMELLRWPGVLSEKQGVQLSEAQLLESFHPVLAHLSTSRLREGARLQALIEQRLASIQVIIAALRLELPLILDRQSELLKERLQRLMLDLDNTRIEQEMALLIQKADVEEELDRLEIHVAEVKHILSQHEPIGRRLDFLMQELNREANTLSSKSIAISSTQAAVDLKVLIEQMREQIQNIE